MCIIYFQNRELGRLASKNCGFRTRTGMTSVDARSHLPSMPVSYLFSSVGNYAGIQGKYTIDQKLSFLIQIYIYLDASPYTVNAEKSPYMVAPSKIFCTNKHVNLWIQTRLAK